MEYEKVTLANLNNGAVAELFDDAFQKVLANIHDINTEEKESRKITLEIEIKPQDRQNLMIGIRAKTKLASGRTSAGAVAVAFQNNKPEAYVHNVNQPDMFTPKKDA